MFAFAQTGAVLHDISHYSESTSTKQQDKAPHSSSLCEKCIAYGELAHALDVGFSVLAAIFAVKVLFVPQIYRYTQASFSAYTARAPPSQLG